MQHRVLNEASDVSCALYLSCDVAFPSTTRCCDGVMSTEVRLRAVDLASAALDSWNRMVSELQKMLSCCSHTCRSCGHASRPSQIWTDRCIAVSGAHRSERKLCDRFSLGTLTLYASGALRGCTSGPCRLMTCTTIMCFICDRFVSPFLSHTI